MPLKEDLRTINIKILNNIYIIYIIYKMSLQAELEFVSK